ncbi:MAG: HEAT repeat domain-containing protein [Planctomycetes bacterium]|nr:HEAT repeat domain-containing protein [Planctomycetota bacterium]
MSEPPQKTFAEIRRRQESIALVVVLGALGISFGIFALPRGQRSLERPPARVDRGRPQIADMTSLTREIWSRSGALGTVKTKPRGELATELAAYGTPMADAALAVLLGEATPPTSARGTVLVDPTEVEELAYAALERLPPEGVMSAIERALASGRMRGKELVALRAIGTTNHARAVEAWLRVATSLSPEALQKERGLTLAAQSFDALLDAAPANRERIRSAADEVTGSALAVIARALSRRDDPAALDVIFAFLGRSARHDGGLLRALGAIARKAQLELAADDARALRKYAREGETIARADALAALGGFADPEAVELMIEALGDPDDLVRTAARSGLERISLSELGNERSAWSSWWARENEWASGRLGLLVSVLGSDDAEVVVAALGELEAHPFLRHTLADACNTLVEDPREPVALAACRAAGKLRSAVAQPGLLRVLGAEKAARRDAACEALRAITGRSLPCQADTWRAALGLD